MFSLFRLEFYDSTLFIDKIMDVEIVNRVSSSGVRFNLAEEAASITSKKIRVSPIRLRRLSLTNRPNGTQGKKKSKSPNPKEKKLVDSMNKN